jgi:phage terminase large subunit-like protein
VANINLHNVSEQEETLRLAEKDLIAFGKLFLPDDFTRSETPVFHYTITDAMFSKRKDGLWTHPNLAVIMPRGHGKTVLTKADIIHGFLFAKEPLFYGWVSATQKLSVGNMDYVKTHLEYNEKIKYYFGNLKGRKWTETDIELKNGCKLISKSNISGIRGGAKLHKRYDLVVLDDFEDENNTITPDARSKNTNMVTAVVHPALEPHGGRLRINGTPVHYDSFINNLIINSQRAAKEKEEGFSWKVILYKAIQSDGTALWNSWFPLEKLEEKKKFYADSGMPYKYWQEYHMEVQSAEDSIFNMRHIKYWDGNFEYDEEREVCYLLRDGKKEPVSVYAGVDPATDSDRRDSDFSVIILIAVDLNNNLYVLDYLRKRGLPVLGIPGEDKKGIVDHIFDFCRIYHPKLFVIEDTTMSRPVFQSLISEMRRRNDFSVKFKEEKPGTRLSKRDRIQEVLAQRFSIGSVHIKKHMFDLQHEIVTFGPRMAHDDTIDALAYAVKYSGPPKGIELEDGEYKRTYPSPKSWIVA